MQLARARDCVHVVVPDSTRIARRAGLDVRRTLVKANECMPWSEVAVATPLRVTLDLLLDQPLPDAVADLDAVLQAGLVELPQVEAMVEGRSDKGIVLARRAGWESSSSPPSCCTTPPAWFKQSAPPWIDDAGECDSAPNGASGTGLQVEEGF